MGLAGEGGHVKKKWLSTLVMGSCLHALPKPPSIITKTDRDMKLS